MAFQPAVTGLRKRELLLLIVVAAGTAWLCGLTCRQSLWLDELHTAWTISGDWQQIGPRAAQGNSPPLYFWCVACASGKPLGISLSVPGLRWLSVTAAVALVMATYGAVRVWTQSVTAAACAAGLLALDTNTLFFGSEARTYMLVQLVSVLQVYVFANMLLQTVPRWRDAAAWSGLSAVLVHLHPTSALLCVAELIYAFLDRRGRGLLCSKSGTIGTGFFLLAILPLFPLVSEISTRRENWQQFVPRPSLLDLLTLFPLGIQVGVPLLCCAAYMLFARTRSMRHSVPTRLWVWCIAWLVIPTLLAWCATRTDVARIFVRRYLIVCSTAGPVIASMLIATIRAAHVRKAVAGITLAIAALPLCGDVRSSGFLRLPQRGQDWSGALRYVARHREEAEPLLLHAGLIEQRMLTGKDAASDAPWYAFCLYPLRSIYSPGISEARQFPLRNTGRLPLYPEDLERVRGCNAAWIISLPARDPLVGSVCRQLKRDGERWQIAERRAFQRVEVYRLAKSRGVSGGSSADASQ